MAHSVNLSVPESREPSQQEDLPDERLTTTIESQTSQELKMEIEKLENSIQELLKEIMQKDQMLKKADSDQTSLKREITELKSQLEKQQEQMVTKEKALIRCSIKETEYKKQIHQLQNQITGSWIIERKAVTIDKSQDAILGRGALGTVYKGRFHSSPVAVKELHRNTPDNAEFSREINVAVNCHHPNVLQIYGMTSDDQNPLIVMELLDCTLRDFIDSQKGQQWLEDGKRLALNIAQGLCYLHGKNPPIVHRDIKSDNILLKKEGGGWKAKVGDYGTAKVFCKEMTPNRGTLAYAAPEAQTKDQQSTKMDVYSFGVVLMEMCTSMRPVIGQLYGQIELVPGPKHKQLIEKCTRISPEERPTMEQVIEILKEF